MKVKAPLVAATATELGPATATNNPETVSILIKTATATKKAPQGAFLVIAVELNLADQGQVRCRNLTVTAGLELIGDLVAFIETLQARTLDSGDVDECVLVAAFRRNEAEALGGVEELYGAGDACHGDMP